MRFMPVLFLAFLLMAGPCAAQRIEIGAKLGVPLTSTIETTSYSGHSDEESSSATRRYTVGPMVGIRLPHGFGLEVDVLYKRIGFNLQQGSVSLMQTHVTGNSWEFPIVGTFRHRLSRSATPYVGAGVSFRQVSGVSTSTVTSFFGQVTTSTGTNSEVLNNRSSSGAVFSAGAELRVFFLRIAPEIRYTRWGSDRNLDPFLYSNQNQSEILLGIVF